MTSLAHDCALLGIQVNPLDLFTTDDPGYVLWLTMLRDRVNDTNREQAAKAKRR